MLGLWISCAVIGGLEAQLVISGILDSYGGVNGVSVIVEFFALEDIPFLSEFALAVSDSSNSFYSTGIAFTFPSGGVSKSQYVYFIHKYNSQGTSLYLSTFFTTEISHFYWTTLAMFTMQGGQALALYRGGVMIDMLGQFGVNGHGSSWDYYGGWLYRKFNIKCPTTQFRVSDWTASGISVMNNWNRNSYNTRPFPRKTFWTSKLTKYAT